MPVTAQIPRTHPHFPRKQTRHRRKLAQALILLAFTAQNLLQMLFPLLILQRVLQNFLPHIQPFFRLRLQLSPMSHDLKRILNQQRILRDLIGHKLQICRRHHSLPWLSFT